MREILLVDVFFCTENCLRRAEKLSARRNYCNLLQDNLRFRRRLFLFQTQNNVRTIWFEKLDNDLNYGSELKLIAVFVPINLIN